jgi:small subunit ribosomal protein S17|tara:strand:- start:60 stop:305 length:246 start_codon:yes stop_codon:yes gene_type:complete
MPKRILQGIVTSSTNKQTITVQVERKFTHPVLKKTIRKSKKYRAHDEKNVAVIGDSVRIQECAPKSKTKSWEMLSEEPRSS